MRYRYVIVSALMLICCAVLSCEGTEFFSAADLDVSGVFQTAGYSGFTAFGVGVGFRRISSDILLGYVPESESSEEIWSITMKLNFTLLKLETARGSYDGYIGARIFYSFDEESFVNLPDRYPDKYYPSTALRTALAFGVESRMSGYSWFVEICCLDLYLEAKVRNWERLEWSEVVSYGMGYRYYFGSNQENI